MGLLEGSMSLQSCLVLGPSPSERDIVGGLAQDQFRPFEDGLEEERIGWTDWRNPMIVPADPDWVIQERFALFMLRIDTRRVPPAILKAHVDLRMQQLMKEKDLAFVGKEARISVADEVKAELLRKVLPTPTIVHLAWDLKGGTLYTTGTGSKAMGALTSLMMKSFGCEIQPESPLLWAGRIAPHLPVEGLMALDPLDLTLDEEE